MLMSLLYSYLFPAMWVSYSAYWWAMSRDVKETERQEPRHRVSHAWF
jgi:hypothetical protein